MVMGRSRLPAGARVALVLIALVTAFAIFAYQDRLARRAAVGRPAPDFTLADAQGRLWRLSALRGRVVVLNFWASWCEVCNAEVPVLETFARRYGDQLTLLGIDWREPASVLRAYVAAHHLSYPNLRDASGRVATAYGLTGVPETWFIGPHGVARVHIVGAVTFPQLQAAYRATTGRGIDGAGVGPVPAGARAHDLAWLGDTLWIAASDGLAEAAPGNTWRAPPILALATGDIRVVAADGPVLFAGGPQVGLWRRRAGGAAWRRLPLPPAAGAPQAFAAAPGDPQRLWVWGATGLWQSGDGGRHWRRLVPASPPPAAPVALAAAPGALWAATADGVYRSSDGGRVWSRAPLWQVVSPGAELATPAAVLLDREPLVASGVAAIGSRVFLAGPQGIWRVGAPGGGLLASSPTRPFAGVAPGPGGSVWAIAPNGDVYRAPAAGGPWRRWRAGAAFSPVVDRP
jgi:cytochrome c biogenesis protein CcmG/thiol:disulfide interchange protein DsbE